MLLDFRNFSRETSEALGVGTISGPKIAEHGFNRPFLLVHFVFPIQIM